MAYKWFRGDIFAIIYLVSGILGLIMTLLVAFFVMDATFFQLLVAVSFCVLFTTVIISGWLTLYAIKHKKRLSLSLAHYHRLNSLITPLIFAISLPKLFGFGFMQIIPIIVLIGIFVVPSIMLMYLYRIPMIPRKQERSWREWMQCNALDVSDR